MMPEGLRPVWTRGPYPTRFAADIMIKRERLVLEEERRRRPGCQELVRVMEGHTIVGWYRLDAPLGTLAKNGSRAKYKLVCELHDTSRFVVGWAAARDVLRHPRRWCEPCSKINTLDEGCAGGLRPRPGFGPVFHGPLAKYG